MFLWTAVALQTSRWLLLPAFTTEDIKPHYDDRNNAGIEARKENKENSKWYKENENRKEMQDEFISWKDYFRRPVPYDALNGDGARNIEIIGVTKIGYNLGAKNHHSATLGHDPILGYIFGTLNIMTSSITFHKSLLPTNKVDLIGAKAQCIKEPIRFTKIFIDAINAEIADMYRIPAAVARQTLHMASDKMSRTGLPIPLLSAKDNRSYL